jgi:hypothetical protein
MVLFTAMTRWGFRVALALSALQGMSTATAADGSRLRLPQQLEGYVTNTVKLSPDERAKLADGAPVAKLVDAEGAQEIAVFGAVWISAPVHRYVEALKDIENFERGGAFTITRRIGDQPKPDDFAELHLPAEDVEDLRSCRVGNCEVKLGEQALDLFRARVDWSAPTAHAAADATMQEIALRYVTGYLEGGNERLAVYRDRERPTFVAREFRDMVDRMPELTTYMPKMRQYLLEFPKAPLAGTSSFLYWQETSFGLKPTIRISHVVIREGPEETTVASKMLYATHYFWTGLELRALVPDATRGPGFWFVTVNRSRSDGLTGFTGALIRRKVESETRNGSLAALQATKTSLEAARR